jgi:hypothetical protein
MMAVVQGYNPDTAEILINGVQADTLLLHIYTANLLWKGCERVRLLLQGRYDFICWQT